MNLFGDFCFDNCENFPFSMLKSVSQKRKLQTESILHLYKSFWAANKANKFLQEAMIQSRGPYYGI